MNTPRIVIIADDLTGANDTGLQLARAGLRTVVSLGDPVADADVSVVNTQSRALSAQQAARLAAAAARPYADWIIYKKMDSTARGHFGAEVAAIMEATRRPRAVLTPAFPAEGRTVRDGHVLLHGVPLEQTSFAHDPTFPMGGSHLPALLEAQGVGEIRHLPLHIVRQGTHAVQRRLATLPRGILVCDAETEDDLTIIARAALGAAPPAVLCGSAGLASALPAACGWDRVVTRVEPICAAPMLIVAGSRNPVTAAQCLHARGAGFVLQSLSPVDLVRAPLAPSACPDIARALSDGHDAIIAVDVDGEAIDGGSERIARHLAVTIRHLVDAARPEAVALTGGDVAYAFCQAAAGTAIRLLDQILPGIPAGRLIGGPLAGLPIVTKAGGFGPPDAFVRIAAYFRGRRSET